MFYFCNLLTKNVSNFVVNANFCYKLDYRCIKLFCVLPWAEVFFKIFYVKGLSVERGEKIVDIWS